MKIHGTQVLELALTLLKQHALRQYLVEHERLPRIGEDRQPWEYSGWQIPYLILADSLTNKRWGYFLSLWLDLRLPDEPIPEIVFSTSNAGQRALQGLEKTLFHHAGSFAWRTTLEWLGWGLGLLDEAPKIPTEISEKLYRSFNLELLLKEAADHLGVYLSESMARGSKKGTGFFPTPMHLSQIMVSMTVGSEDVRLKTINDPAVGTGSFLLAASNHSLLLSGNDINADCVLSTRIQGALYAPWLTWGIPAQLTPTDEVPESPAEDVGVTAAVATESPVQLDLGLS